MEHTRLICLLMVYVLIFTACAGTEEQSKVLKLAHGLSPSHSVHKGLVYLSEQLEELSDGKMKIDIYESAQLGSEMQCVELLQIGSLDITKVSSATLEGFVDAFKVFGIPYIFHSRQHYNTVLKNQLGKDILASSEPVWVRGLTYFDSGARSFYTVNKPILKPEDLRGLKIRVQKSPVAVEMMRTFGSSATPVDWGELYTALQSNVVDGAENNTPSITTAFHHEVAKYYSVNEHTMCPDVIIISLATWKKMSEQEREWLQIAADRASIYQQKLWIEQEKTSLAEMKDRGMEIIYPDKQAFIDAAQPMIERFKSDAVFTNLIEKIQQVE